MTHQGVHREVDSAVKIAFREDDAIKGCVLKVCGKGVLVCDLCSLRELLIQTPDAAEFRPGDRVRIEYSGDLSAIGPIPQIEAEQICFVKKNCRHLLMNMPPPCATKPID